MSTLTDILRNTFSSDATDYLVTLISSSVRDESKSQDVEGMFGDLLSQLKKTKETI